MWRCVLWCRWEMAIQHFQHAKAHFNRNDEKQFAKKTEEDFFRFVSCLSVCFFVSYKNACNLIREAVPVNMWGQNDSHQTCKLYLILSWMLPSCARCFLYWMHPCLAAFQLHKSKDDTLQVLEYFSRATMHLNRITHGKSSPKRERTKSKNHFIISTKVEIMLRTLSFT